MAISDTQKVDYLWKKIGYAATKTDTVANKEGYNEAIPSPLQIRGDKVMTDSGLIPGTIPVANTSIVSVYTTSLPIECTNDATASTNRTWKTNVTDWISPEFGSTYQVKVYVNLSNSAGNAASAGTQLFASGSGNNDEWFFDYQSGVLNFIGTSLPSGVSFTGKSVYVSGAEYTGGFGVSAPGSSGSVGNLTISNVTISANSSAVSSSANIIFSTSGTGAVQFAGNNAIGLPIGNIANRPTTVNAGYLRFNTEFETIEVWDGYEWVQTSGGVITSQVLSGDGSTAQVALSANTTTAGVLVSINGTIQKPSTAYTVSNNTITFTETPLTGDSIEVRKLAGGTISVNYGNADVATFLSTYSGLYSNVQTLTYLTSGVAGNIIPSANVTYSLGSITNQWKDLFVSNNTIYIGGIPLTIDASGNLSVNGSQVQGSGSGSGTNYSNVNVSALITTNGLTNYSNVNTASYTTAMGFQNFSNVNVAAYVTTNGLTNYSNVNVSALITTNGLTNYSNVNVASYLSTANINTTGNVTAQNLIGNISITGNVTGILPNVTITAGTFVSTFNNAGNVILPNVYVSGNITVGNITGKTNGFTIGYLEMPQVASGNVTLALTDSGKHFYNTTVSPQTITIPTFANVAFGNGTVVSIANQSTSNISVALQSGVILYLAGNATSASRTITSYGIATLLKVNTNTWFINGSGVA